jgi:hypothetical protein
MLHGEADLKSQALPAAKRKRRLLRNVHQERMRNALRPCLLQNDLSVLAVTDQLVAFDHDPLAGIARTVRMKPLPLAPTVIERGLGARFVSNGHDQVLLFREGEWFERAENARLVHDLQLLRH